MVGIVIVSHSQRLADGVVELMHMVAKDAPTAAAGGMLDGGLGTSFEKISAAVESVDQGDGCVILMDMGSAVMTAEMVVEAMDDHHIVLLDGPLVEGAVLAAAAALQGKSAEEIGAQMDEARQMEKVAD